jgi:hypothetical protein
VIAWLIGARCESAADVADRYASLLQRVFVKQVRRLFISRAHLINGYFNQCAMSVFVKQATRHIIAHRLITSSSIIMRMALCLLALPAARCPLPAATACCPRVSARAEGGKKAKAGRRREEGGKKAGRRRVTSDFSIDSICDLHGAGCE